jgi:hypothetical protein
MQIGMIINGEMFFSQMRQEELWKPDGRDPVYRRIWKRYAECKLIKTVSFGEGSTMVYCEIS